MSRMLRNLEHVTVARCPADLTVPDLYPLLTLAGAWVPDFTVTLAQVSDNMFAPEATYTISQDGKVIYARREGINMMFLAQTSSEPVVRCSRYRQATLAHHFLRLPRREHYDDENQLAKRAGARDAGNHVVYSIGNAEAVSLGVGNILHVRCSDEYISLGLRKLSGCW
jgi:hypothetical protein